MFFLQVSGTRILSVYSAMFGSQFHGDNPESMFEEEDGDSIIDACRLTQ